MSHRGGSAAYEAQPDHRTVTDRISQATAAGITPGSPEGQALLDSVVPSWRGRDH